MPKKAHPIQIVNQAWEVLWSLSFWMHSLKGGVGSCAHVWMGTAEKPPCIYICIINSHLFQVKYSNFDLSKCDFSVVNNQKVFILKLSNMSNLQVNWVLGVIGMEWYTIHIYDMTCWVASILNQNWFWSLFKEWPFNEDRPAISYLTVLVKEMLTLFNITLLSFMIGTEGLNVTLTTNRQHYTDNPIWSQKRDLSYWSLVNICMFIQFGLWHLDVVVSLQPTPIIPQQLIVVLVDEHIVHKRYL